MSPVTPIVHNLFDEKPKIEDRTVESIFLFLRDVLRSSMMITETETPRSVQDLTTSSKLLTLYAGDLVSSLGLFGELKDKDVNVWNSMITGSNQNGHYITWQLLDCSLR